MSRCSKRVCVMMILVGATALGACGSSSQKSTTAAAGIHGPSETPKSPVAPATPRTGTTSTPSAPGPYDSSLPGSTPITSPAFHAYFVKLLTGITKGPGPSPSRINAIVDCIFKKFEAQGLTTNLAVGNAPSQQREGDVNACFHANP